MNRRNFLKNIGIVVASIPLLNAEDINTNTEDNLPTLSYPSVDNSRINRVQMTRVSLGDKLTKPKHISNSIVKKDSMPILDDRTKKDYKPQSYKDYGCYSK